MLWPFGGSSFFTQCFKGHLAEVLCVGTWGYGLLFCFPLASQTSLHPAPLRSPSLYPAPFDPLERRRHAARKKQEEREKRDHKDQKQAPLVSRLGCVLPKSFRFLDLPCRTVAVHKRRPHPHRSPIFGLSCPVACRRTGATPSGFLLVRGGPTPTFETVVATMRCRNPAVRVEL